MLIDKRLENIDNLGGRHSFAIIFQASLMRGFFICAMQALKVMRLPCKQEKTLQVRRVAPD